MDYDIIIATMNRPDALRLSIPLILRQSRKPQQLIIVDASNDHEKVKKTVIEAVNGAPIKLEIAHTEANISRQRNLGLKYVKSPVVIFPDDDSLWWPGVAEAILHVYELDENGDIGGVCARETNVPPPDANLTEDGIYKMTTGDRIRQKISRLRHKFDKRFCPDPLWVHGESRWTVRPFPQWLQNINAAMVEFMGGFRMSFRTELIRKYGFDEDLGAYIGYAAYEDADASFKILREKLLVGAHDAHVYHYKAPNKRASGFELGFILLFNRAYLICRYSSPGSRARAVLKRFAFYKLSQYLLHSGSKFGRERVRGTLTAIKNMKYLIDSPLELLRQRYLELCQEVLNGHENKSQK